MGYATIDHDATVGGDVTITGTLQAGVTASDTGTIATDVTIAADKFLKCASGTGVFDWSPSSGTFKTSTGVNTIGGATVFAANKGVTVASGTSAFDFSGGSGLFKTSTGAVTLGPGKVSLSGVLVTGVVNQSSTNMVTNTTLLSATVKPTYYLTPSGAHVGLQPTLPPAAEMTDATIEFINRLTVTNSCHVTIYPAGSEKINNAASIYCTAKYATIKLKSDGTEWYIVSSVGTWT